MQTTCPNCEREQFAPVEAVFCMYCGHKLPERAVTQSAAVGRVSESPIALESNQFLDPQATQTYRGSVGEASLAVAGFPPLEGVPERVGGYRLKRRLGVGGMGQVFEAESEDGSERVAVKLLTPKLATNPTSVERFRQEGRLASQISHPRCVFVYGVDAEGGRPFIVMELMPGSTLKDLVDRKGPLPWDQAIRRILDVIDGLIEAHRVGMLHRDVKPSNCFLTVDDRVKIGDFGLSKSLDTHAMHKQLTSSGTFLGTVLYASPEQIRGEEVSYDSDVYSVAATLYFLLTGRAPYQHESMTAAVAKAISEPPPSIRKRRPDVPSVLEAVVLRGMERDRKRRYATLEEFRDALADLLPERQHPPSLRAITAAYLIDMVFAMLLIQIPISLLESYLGWSHRPLFNSASDPLTWGASIAYFAFTEGLFGATLGKLLVGLRVQRLHRPGPPGLLAAFVRSLIFHALWWVAFALPELVGRFPRVGPLLAILALLVGLAGLLVQVWPWPLYWIAGRIRIDTSTPYRGLHDWLTQCRIVQRSRPVQRLRLLSTEPSPLDRLRPIPEPAPSTIGGYMLLGQLADQPTDGSRVWVGEDSALNRRVLIWLRPAKALPDGLPEYPVRPSRLRVVSTGDVVLQDGAYAWAAFVAPDGAPLLQTIHPERPLGWQDARVILEQLVEELQIAEQDRTLPERLGLDQLWAEPDGRIHLLEFPIGKPIPPAKNSIELVRQTAILTLEGQNRSSRGRVAAPLPSHATRILDLLTTDDECPSLAYIQRQLRDSHASPARVTLAMRAAHISLIAALSGVGLLVLLALTGMFAIHTVLELDFRHRIAGELLGSLDNEQQLEMWRQRDDLLKAHLAPEQLNALRDKLVHVQHAIETVADEEYLHLTQIERMAVDGIRAIELPRGRGNRPPPIRATQQRLLMDEEPIETLANPARIREDRAWLIVRMMLVVWMGFILFATVFRGGLSFMLSGITLVTANGRLASRWQCAGREALVWVPIMLTVVLSVVLQALYPTTITIRITALGVVVAVIVTYLVIGLRYPERGPHDYLMGTHMVPA